MNTATRYRRGRPTACAPPSVPPSGGPDAETLSRWLAAVQQVLSLLTEAEALDGAMPRVLAAIGPRFGFDLGVFWTFDTRAGVLRPRALWEASPGRAPAFVLATAEVTCLPGEGPIGRAWRSGSAFWCEDISREPSFRTREAAVRSGLHSDVLMPLSWGGRVHGVLELLSRSAMPRDEELMRALATCAAVLGQYADRTTAHGALRRTEHRLAAILQGVGDAVLTTDATARITAMNAAAEAATGWPFEEARARALREVLRVLDPQTRQPLERPLVDGTATAGGVSFLDAILVDRGGREAAVRLGSIPVRTGRDVSAGSAIVFRDADGRRGAPAGRQFLFEAAIELARSLDYHETSSQIAGLLVPRLADWCAVDLLEADDSLQRVAAAHVDADKVELVRELQRGRPLPSDAPTGVRRALETGHGTLIAALSEEALAASGRDTEYLRVLRELGFGSLLAVPLVAHGRVIGAISLMRVGVERPYDPGDLALAEDLGRLAGLALSNARLHRDVQAADRAKDEFMATLSHELRTPMNAMLGWAQLLRVGKLDEPTRARAAETIERNAKLQAQLIEDLMDVSRIITGKLRLEVRWIEVRTVLDAAADSVRPGATAKGVDLAVRVAPGLVVRVDPSRLQQVVWNLLSNALKFTSRGGRVNVAAELVEGAVEISVEDTGKGISADLLPHVFERFRQGDATTARPQTGLGLGLAIVRHLVELHRGVVRAESEGEGRGARFIVRLPVGPPYDEAGERGNAPGETMNAPPSSPTLEGLHVLVVDDEADARELLVTVLGRLGARVTATSSAEEALAALQRDRPDVLVSDIALPGEDGYALIRRVRALGAEQGGAVPAAALTAYARLQDRTRSLLAGFQSHVPKPVEPVELAAVVASLAGRTGKA